MTPNQTKALDRLLKETPKFARDETQKAFERLIEGNDGMERAEFTVDKSGTAFECVLDLTPTESKLNHPLLIVSLSLRPTNKDQPINFIAEA